MYVWMGPSVARDQMGKEGQQEKASGEAISGEDKAAIEQATAVT